MKLNQKNQQQQPLSGLRLEEFRPGRRRFLERGLQLAAVLPLARSFLKMEVAHALGEVPLQQRKLVIFQSPLGTAHVDWESPQRDSAGNVQLGRIVQPFAPIVDKTCVMNGFNIAAGPQGHAAINWLLSGTGKHKVGKAHSAGPSIDQVIKDRLGMESIEIAAMGGNAGSYSTLVYRENGQRVPAESDPLVLFSRLFGKPLPAAGTASNATGASSFEELKSRARVSVFDDVRDELRRLRAEAPAEFRSKIDAHLESVRSLERGVTGTLAQAPQSPSLVCDAPQNPVFQSGQKLSDNYLENIQNFSEIIDLHMDVLFHAFKCDLAGVATFRFTNEGTQFPFHRIIDVQADAGHHDMSHGEKNYGPDGYISRVQRFYGEKVAQFAQRLEATSVSDGTMLDRSLVMWINSMARGDEHHCADLPVLLAGGSWFMKGNQYVKYRRRPTNDLLHTIDRAFGSTADHFGTRDKNTGVLSEIQLPLRK